jgi:hypothetical protein
MVNNKLNCFITVGDAGSYLESVLIDLGHGTYEMVIGSRYSYDFAQGVMSLYPGRRG